MSQMRSEPHDERTPLRSLGESFTSTMSLNGSLHALSLTSSTTGRFAPLGEHAVLCRLRGRKNRARCARTFTLLPFYENFLPRQAFTILIANGRIFTVPRDYVFSQEVPVGQVALTCRRCSTHARYQGKDAGRLSSCAHGVWGTCGRTDCCASRASVGHPARRLCYAYKRED